jgi:hypothetical protein
LLMEVRVNSKGSKRYLDKGNGEGYLVE